MYSNNYVFVLFIFQFVCDESKAENDSDCSDEQLNMLVQYSNNLIVTKCDDESSVNSVRRTLNFDSPSSGSSDECVSSFALALHGMS